jgi:glutaconate CoA-transferase subunit A
MPVERPFQTLETLVSTIPNGAMLALPKDESGVPSAAVRQLIQRGVKDLHLLCVPACGFHADLLIGADCVATVECAGIVIGEIGVGPRFQAAVRAGTVKLKDSSCPAIHAGLQAGAKGAPFAATRGILGSDLINIRKDWRVINNPFADGEDPVLVVPAINPDVFLFHARWGDRFGNVWTGGRRDLAYTAHAARKTFVTVENIWGGNLMTDPVMAAGTLNEIYIAGSAHVPHGTWPMTLQHVHVEDTEHIKRYVAMARTDEGFNDYVQEFVRGADVAVPA